MSDRGSVTISAHFHFFSADLSKGVFARDYGARTDVGRMAQTTLIVTGTTQAYVPRVSERSLGRIVHLELDRMRRVFEPNNLGHLQLDIGVDEIVIEYAANFQETPVFIKLFEGLTQ